MQQNHTRVHTTRHEMPRHEMPLSQISNTWPAPRVQRLLNPSTHPPPSTYLDHHVGAQPDALVGCNLVTIGKDCRGHKVGGR